MPCLRSRQMLFIFAALASGAWIVWAASPVKLGDVATADELTKEVLLLVADVQQTLKSVESFNDGQERLKRSASQIAVLSQALSEHDASSSLKAAAPDLRDAAIAVGRAKSFEEATQLLVRLNQAAEGKATGKAKVEFDWGKLSRLGVLMHAMKDRSEALRKSFRRSRDPEVESRHAMVIAVMALAAHGDTHEVKNPADKPAWHDACLQLQGHMTKTAAAFKSRDPAAADHFRLGMETCGACHEKFKP